MAGASKFKDCKFRPYSEWGLVAHTSKPSSRDDRTRKPLVQGQPEFQVNLGYSVRPFLKWTNKHRKHEDRLNKQRNAE